MLTRILVMQLRSEAQISHSKETPDLELAKVCPKHRVRSLPLVSKKITRDKATTPFVLDIINLIASFLK